MRSEISTKPSSVSLYSSLCACGWMRLYWRRHLFSSTCKALALLAGVASVLIFYSEFNMSTNRQSPIGASIVSLSRGGAGVFAVQVTAFTCLCYMNLCTFWSLFKLNLGWSYTLQGPHQSPDTSLLFNATYLARLQFSLGYNFLLFLNSKK
jgi:hypothetical protein